MILRVPALLLIAAGMLAGDLVAGIDAAPVLAVVALGAALMAVLVPWPLARAWRDAAALVLLSFGWACSAGAGVYSPQLAADHVARLALPAKLKIAGTVAADADHRGATQRLLIDVEAVDAGRGSVPASGRILLYVRESRRTWAAGERLAALVSLRQPRNFGNPGEFDYRAYLARRQVYVTGFAFDDTAFELLKDTAAGPTAIGRWRQELRTLFLDQLPGETGAVLCALVLGDTGALSEDLVRAFGRSGTRHVLTISGLHVGMVSAGSYGLFRWLLGRSPWLLLVGNVPKIAVAVSVLPVLIYARLAGGGVATMRAMLMAVVFLGAVVVDRRRHLFVSLAVAAILLTVADPGVSQEISFQLSFAAVFGLVLALERFWPWWLRQEEERLLRLQPWRGRVWRSIALYLVVSAAALAATTPLSAFYFNQVSIMALLANSVVVPLLGSVAVALGLVASLLYVVAPLLALPLVWLAGVAIDLGVAAVWALAAVPFAAFAVVTPTKVELVLLYTGMFAALRLRGRRRVVALAMITCLLSADAAWWYSERFHAGELRVTFLSVGQGDSAVVEFPGGDVMVVDGGGLMSPSFDVGERILAPFLRSRRIAAVDYLVVTHPQWDHYGGLAYLAEHFAPRQLWTTGAESTSAAYARLLERARAGGAQLRVMQRGDVALIGGAAAVVTAPPLGGHGFGTNDRSLVLTLEYGGRRVLLTGDIEAPAEQFLVRATGDALRSAVVKVPHHGSASSSTAAFVDAVRPQLAVISSGFGNRYGFPVARVLGRYAAASSAVLRTDLDGAVEVRITAAGNARVRTWERPDWSALASMASG